MHVVVLIVHNVLVRREVSSLLICRQDTRHEAPRHSLQLQMLIGHLEPQWAAVSCIYNLAICVEYWLGLINCISCMQFTMKTKL